MPIQWSGRITSPQQLASVIQGEAATPAGQFAVASVMYNRMTTPGPYLGGGSGDISQVVTPTQFNGFNSQPSSYATQLADNLWNGQAPSGGDPGNATFFAAPSASNAAWANPNTVQGQGLFANGTNIGGNYFTDTQGAPSPSYVAPSYTGSGAIADTAQSGVAGDQSGSYVGYAPADAYSGSGMSDTGGAFAGVSGSASASADLSGGVTANADASTQSSAISGPSSLQTIQSDLGSQVNSSAVAGALGAAGGGGIPIQVTDISNAGESAANTVSKATTQASNTVSNALQKSVSGLVTGLTNITGSGLSGATDILVRAGLFILAAVLLIGAFMFFGEGGKDVKISLAP